MHDIRHLDEYRAVEETLRQWHAPAFGRPHALSEPEIAPDGARVLVTASVIDALEGVPQSRLFTATAGELAPAVGMPGASRCGRFSPDGQRVAFLADPDDTGVFQLHLAAADGTDAAAGAEVDGTVEYLQWSPDGGRVLLGVAGHGADLAGGQGSGTHSTPADDLPSWHPLVETGVPDHGWRTVWVYDVEAGTVARVSPEGVNCWEASWCGSDRIVAVTSTAPDEDSWYAAAVSLLDPEAGTARTLLRSEVQLALPSASPDGRFVSIVEAVCSDRQIVAGDLLVIDRSTGDPLRLDTLGTDVTSARWFADRRLGFVGQRGLESVLGVFDATSGLVEERHSAPRSWGYRYPDAAYTASGDALVVEDAYRVPHQLVRIGPDGAEVLASVRHPGTDRMLEVCGRAVAVSWDAPDGTEIEGVLALPDADGPHPLVVSIHGGPVWAFQESWSMNYPWVPLLVSRGYAVLSPNPRGSGGRGQEYAGRVVGDMGGEDTLDHLSGVDALVARGLVDPARIGLIGGSYGGFMSSWLVTQDSRFAAAVPISPVTDWYSQSFTSNVAGWGQTFLRADPEVPGSAVHSRSPVLHASKVRTPCMNVAGARDRCTPPEQAREFHQALVSHGVESRLVIYPEEGHGVRSFSVMPDFLTRVLLWFERHMPA